MRKQRLWGFSGQVLCAALLVGAILGVPRVAAETATSENFQMVETEFGAGTNLESCSSQYCAKASIGDMGGTSSATTPEFGEVKYTEPTLEMIVGSGQSNLGVLTTEHTATKTMTIKVRNYLTGGYTLQILGDAPKFDGHTLETVLTPEASTPGTEQFGMNIVANTAPKVGEDPVQVPADAGVFGEAAEGYATANMFKYQSGDVFARSTQNTGGTDYTVTMIVNISSNTPSGHYTGDFAAVLMPAY